MKKVRQIVRWVGVGAAFVVPRGGVRQVVRLVAVVAALIALPTMWQTIGSSQGRDRVPAEARRYSKTPKPLPSNRQRDWGRTYYEIEAKARKVTAQFQDEVVTAARDGHGATDIDVVSRTGARLAKAKVSPAGNSGSIDFDGPRGRKTTALTNGVRPTLDWSAIQSHLMTVDSPSLVRQPRWRDGFVRSDDQADDPNDSPAKLTTDFGDGIVATTYRRGANLADAMAKGTPYFTTVLTRDDEGLGLMQWHPGMQLLNFQFPGLTEGKLRPDVLEPNTGGWTFTPTMAWANIQARAFYDSGMRKKADGALARAGGCPSGAPSLASRVTSGLSDLLSPTLHAEEGCDYLHWLDDTIFRQCCDDHDLCYQTYNCTVWSWINPFTSWRCENCNRVVVACFSLAVFLCDIDPECHCLYFAGGWWDPELQYCFIDPIVIPLDDRAAKLQMTAAEDGVMFDANASGVKRKVAWSYPGSGTGFLVLDRNGNGRIDNGSELFGNNTLMRDGSRAEHGFEALKDLDGGDNSDGAVTPSDPWFSSLQIWVDRNHNGESERGELLTLEDAGVASLSTKYAESKRIDRNGNGYPFAAEVTFARGIGRRTTTRTYYDVFLQSGE